MGNGNSKGRVEKMDVNPGLRESSIERLAVDSLPNEESGLTH